MRGCGNHLICSVFRSYWTLPKKRNSNQRAGENLLVFQIQINFNVQLKNVPDVELCGKPNFFVTGKCSDRRQ